MNARWLKEARPFWLGLALWFSLATGVSAQGFAGLGTVAEGFAVPTPDRAITLPADHGAHPGYRIEWWYLTANLKTRDGTDMGLQWTLFRSALRPDSTDADSPAHAWMGHAAVTDASTHRVSERLAMGGRGQAGVTMDPFTAFIDDWVMTSTAKTGEDPYDRLRLSASGPDFAYDMTLTAQGPIIRHGQDGYSVKSEDGQASYYYAQPFYQIEGTILTADGAQDVTGTAWLDREWSSQPLSPDQTGWDWFSLSFESGDKLMGFLLRSRNGTAFASGTWIDRDGTATPLSPGAFIATPLERSRVAGRSIPTSWAVRLPAHGVDVIATAVNPAAWMETSFPYWEGPVRVDGSHRGHGYLEMTGYPPS